MQIISLEGTSQGKGSGFRAQGSGISIGGTHAQSKAPSMDSLLQEHHPCSEHPSPTGYAPVSA